MSVTVAVSEIKQANVCVVDTESASTISSDMNVANVWVVLIESVAVAVSDTLSE